MTLSGNQQQVQLFRVTYVPRKNEPYETFLTAFHKVGRVTAVDQDYPPNCLTYKIAKGDIQVLQRFWIHPLSGVIELTTQPDYESVKQYNLTVEAVDCDAAHPRTGVSTVSREVTKFWFVTTGMGRH